MNLDRIKKAIGERVQLRPVVIPVDAGGRGLAPTDDAWVIEAVTDEDVRVSNPRTGHFTHLGKDHIHHYTTNPDETRRTGIPHGFFTLLVQIYVQGAELRVTPTARPGEPVHPQPPAPIEVERRYQPSLFELGGCSWVSELDVPEFENVGYTHYPHPSGALMCFRMTSDGRRMVKEFLMVKPGAKRV